MGMGNEVLLNTIIPAFLPVLFTLLAQQTRNSFPLTTFCEQKAYISKNFHSAWFVHSIDNNKSTTICDDGFPVPFCNWKELSYSLKGSNIFRCNNLNEVEKLSVNLIISSLSIYLYARTSPHSFSEFSPLYLSRQHSINK